MAPAKLLGILLLLFIFLKSGHCGKKKGKTIKIHVPYYVKHIHHYKKVFVPKVQVIKHEHHHKKEHDHHHHHHDDHHGHHHHGYDKSGHVGYDESVYDPYYDDLDNRNYIGGSRYGGRRGKFGGYRASGSEQYLGWRDVDGSEYRGDESLEEEEDYADVSGPGDLIPGPGPGPYNRYRKSQNLIVPVYRKRLRGRDRLDRRSDSDSDSEVDSNETAESPSQHSPPGPVAHVAPVVTPIKTVLARVTTTEDVSS